MTAEDKLRQFIISDLRWPGSPGDLRSDASLLDLNVLDSLAIVQLTAFLEAEFSIHVDSADVVPRNFETIDAIVHYIDGKRDA